jgi:hypothetical protein
MPSISCIDTIALRTKRTYPGLVPGIKPDSIPNVPPSPPHIDILGPIAIYIVVSLQLALVNGECHPTIAPVPSNRPMQATARMMPSGPADMFITERTEPFRTHITDNPAT